MLYLKPAAGLCNRLRAIDSCLSIARRRNDELCVWWVADEGMRESFKDLLQPPAEFHLIDIGEDASSIKKLFSDENPDFRNRPFWNNPADSQVIIDEYRSGNRQNLCVWSGQSFVGERDYAWMRPKAEILADVMAMQRKFRKNCIGVHIRRTDNLNSRQYSPLKLFEKKIEEEVNADSDVGIFLATDDDIVKRRLGILWGDRILMQNGIAKRFEEGGVVRGLVDFLLLSRTRRVYASYWSSFSGEASFYGRIPRTVVKSERPVVEITLLCRTNSEAKRIAYAKYLVNVELINVQDDLGDVRQVLDGIRGEYIGFDDWDARAIGRAYDAAVLGDADVVVSRGKSVLVRSSFYQTGDLRNRRVVEVDLS